MQTVSLATKGLNEENRMVFASPTASSSDVAGPIARSDCGTKLESGCGGTATPILILSSAVRSVGSPRKKYATPSI